MKTIAHSYDSYAEAERVVHALEAAGVPHGDISLVSGEQGREPGTEVSSSEDDISPAAATGASIGSVLGGGVGLLAGLGALAIPGVGPVVAAGWLIATLTGAGMGAAAGGLLGSLTNAGLSEVDALTHANSVGRGGTLVTVRVDDDREGEIRTIFAHPEAMHHLSPVSPLSASTHEAEPLVTASANEAKSLPVVAAEPVSPAASLAEAPGSSDDVIHLVREDLVVGTHQEQGTVRIQTHVVETPVEQQVAMHNERVVVERRPVEHTATLLDHDVFADRTIEATETTEEVVVSKTARVYEEVVLRKEASDRVETIRDTVRETKADIEYIPAGQHVSEASGTETTSVAGCLRDNEVTRAVDHSLDTNLSGQNSA